MDKHDLEELELASLKIKAVLALLEKLEPEIEQKRKNTTGLGIIKVIFQNIREILK